MSSLKEKIKNVSYGALETMTRNSGLNRKIGGFDIRFPARYARYYESDYEPVTFDFLRRNCKSGGVFLDCGAHIGLFAVVGAKLVGKAGKVFSFEPTPNTRNVLEEVIRLNDCQNITEVRGEAIAEKSGTATFFDTGNDVSNANSLVQTERHDEGLSVPTVSIDDFAAERNLKIQVLKIDVEGAELNALRGAFQTLKNDCPPLSLGLHPNAISQSGATLEEIWNFLNQFDYRITYESQTIDKTWFTTRTDLFDVQCCPRPETQK